MPKRIKWVGIGSSAAAAVIAMAILGFHLFAPGTSLALADVQAEFEKMGWVHVKYDTGAIEEQ